MNKINKSIYNTVWHDWKSIRNDTENVIWNATWDVTYNATWDVIRDVRHTTYNSLKSIYYE